MGEPKSAPGRNHRPVGARSKRSRIKWPTKAQELLLSHLIELYGPQTEFQYEYQFMLDAGRKFAFDIADMTNHIGYECDGGQWGGGHMRGLALEKQYEKDRLAQLWGWRIFRFTNRQVLTGEARAWIEEYTRQV